MEHVLNRRSESPLPEDVQPWDLQQRELRYRHLSSMAGSYFPEGPAGARGAYSRSPDADDRPFNQGFLADRRRTVATVAPISRTDSGPHPRRGAPSSVSESDYGDDADAESRPLLSAGLRESPTPREGADHPGEDEAPGRNVSFESVNGDVPDAQVYDTMMLDQAAGAAEEPRFGIDFDYLLKHLADQAAGKLEHANTSSSTSSSNFRRRKSRSGSSMLRGLVSADTGSTTHTNHFEPQPRLPAKTTVSFHSPGYSASASSIGGLDFSAFGKTLPEVMQDPAGSWFWIDVENLDAQTMRTLARVFSIHPLTCEDILSATEERTGREKVEFFLGYYFVVLRSFDADENSEDYLEPLTLHYLVGGANQRDDGTREPGWIITFHPTEVHHPANVLRRMELLRAYGLHITADWISYALVDDVVDHFLPILDMLEYEVDSIDDLVFILNEAEQSDMLKRIGEARRRVTTLLRLLTVKSDVIKTLVKRGSARWIRHGDSEVGVYLGDVQDHVQGAVANLQHYDSTLTRAHANYLATINLEITISSHKTSDVVMRISVVGAVLVPLNIITSAFGMNVTVPYQHEPTEVNIVPFYAIVGFMTVWTVAVLSYARHRGYL
ncbi:hypothetical protein DFJ74DRAFT_685097 [Hyaloraphidium curvatum]|nr:hypothetical protein DFJ74DRAFT_685097 [Hyaloraphidium curvatum]